MESDVQYTCQLLPFTILFTAGKVNSVREQVDYGLEDDPGQRTGTSREASVID